MGNLWEKNAEFGEAQEFLELGKRISMQNLIKECGLTYTVRNKRFG